MRLYWEITLASFYMEKQKREQWDAKGNDVSVFVPQLTQIQPQTYRKETKYLETYAIPSRGDRVILAETLPDFVGLFPRKVADKLIDFPLQEMVLILEDMTVHRAVVMDGNSTDEDYKREKNEAAEAMWVYHEYLLKLGFERVRD